MTVRGAIFRWRVDPVLRQTRGQRRARGEEGSVILETALSAIILLTFLFGIMETGFALFTYHFISNAAREATRYAIVRGSSCTSFASACPAQKSDIQNYVTTLGFSGITASNVVVNYAAYPAGVTCAPSIACNNPGNRVTVAVTYNFLFNVPFVPAKTFAMTSSSSMIISQ
jgi:Flp pilus assembly protein TadG